MTHPVRTHPVYWKALGGGRAFCENVRSIWHVVLRKIEILLLEGFEIIMAMICLTKTKWVEEKRRMENWKGWYGLASRYIVLHRKWEIKCQNEFWACQQHNRNGKHYSKVCCVYIVVWVDVVWCWRAGCCDIIFIAAPSQQETSIGHFKEEIDSGVCVDMWCCVCGVVCAKYIFKPKNAPQVLNLILYESPDSGLNGNMEFYLAGDSTRLQQSRSRCFVIECM